MVNFIYLPKFFDQANEKLVLYLLSYAPHSGTTGLEPATPGWKNQKKWLKNILTKQFLPYFVYNDHLPVGLMIRDCGCLREWQR